MRASSVHSVHVLRARQELLELELDGEGHRVLLSDADPEAFWPLPELPGPGGNASLQARWCCKHVYRTRAPVLDE